MNINMNISTSTSTSLNINITQHQHHSTSTSLNITQHQYHSTSTSLNINIKIVIRVDEADLLSVQVFVVLEMVEATVDEMSERHVGLVHAHELRLEHVYNRIATL